MREELISQLQNDKNFDVNGNQTAEGIVDSLLSQSSAFKDYALEYQRSLEQIQNAKKEIQPIDINTLTKNNDVKEWFDSLSDEDKQLVYEVSIKSDDTTLWTLTRWKQELTDMSAAGKTSEESLQSFYNVMNNTEDGNFSGKVNDYLDNVQKLQDALSKIDMGELSESDKLKLVMDFPQLAGHTGDINSLKNAISSLIDTSNQGINDEIDAQIQALGGDGTTAANALESLRNIINEIGKSSGWNFDIDDEIKKFNNLYNAMKDSVSGTGLSTQGIKNVEAMFSGLKGYDASILFEKTEHGIHLNTTALRALQSQYESTTKLGIQEKLQNLKQEYNDSAKAVEGLTKGTEAYNKALSDKGLRSTDAILADIENVQTLAAQYEGLTSAYNKWVLAKSSGEEGDMYDNIAGSLKDIKQLYDDGLVGTNAFRSAVQMMTNEDLSTANIDKIISVYEEGMPVMQKYFTTGREGCETFLQDVSKINSEWAKVNENGDWEINFGIGNDEAIAKAISDMTGLEMSTEEVQLIMRKLSDYGFDIKLDSAYSSIDELKSKIETTESKLKSLGQKPVDINVNTDNVDVELEKAKNKIQEIKDSDVDIEVKTAQLEDAYAKVDLLVTKANQPAFMTIDVSQVDSELQGSLTLLQEYQNAVNNLNALQIKGADTSEIEAAKGKVDELAGKIKSLPAEQKTKIGLEADDSVETIKTKISTGEVKIPISADISQVETDIASIDGQDVKVNVTTSGNEAIDNLKTAIDGIQDKNVKITATVEGIDSVEELKTGITNLTGKTIIATAKVVGTNLVFALKSAIDQLYNKTVSVGANVFGTSAVQALKYAIDSLYSKTVTATTVTKNVAGVDGTAYARGTAFKQGSWGTKESGIALGGELGQELVVRDGRYFTIGDKGAEFFKYKKGDIIFNAEQTKQIFEKGKIIAGNGRGKALVTGTASGIAFSSGSGSFRNNTTTNNNANTSNGGGSGSNNGGSGNNTGGNNDTEKKFEETFDWIEIAIDRIKRAIDTLDKKASSTYRSWSERNENLVNEMSKTSDEIKLQESAYNRYIEQANSVGLSPEWMEKVKNGLVDIDTITDETLADQIKDFKEWYEKALDCRDAVVDLQESYSKLYQTAFENVAFQYEGILGIIQHEQSMIEEYINQVENKGYLVSTKYYEALIAKEEQNVAQLEQKKADQINKLSEAVNSGAIEKGSEAWYEMVNAINETTLAIEQGNTKLTEYAKTIQQIKWNIFDLLQDKISAVTTESKFLINLLSSADLYNDKGQLTVQGQSTVGLHTVNYNVYMSQADEYAQEMLEINKQLANDPTNEELAKRRQELLELQQDMIIAAEDEKDAIVDMVKEGIKLELDSLKDLIDKYKDVIDTQKDLYSWQNKIKDQTSEIAVLQKQLQAYSGDTSEETKTTIQKIKVDLEKAQDNLKESEYDKYISDQKALLDELYLDYETTLNMRLDNIDSLISDMINVVNNNSGEIASALYTATENVGYTMSVAMNDIWSKAYEQTQSDSALRVQQVTDVLNQLVANGSLTQYEANQLLTALGNGTATQAAQVLNIIKQMINNGSITSDTGNSIIASLNTNNVQAANDSLKLIQQLVDNGTLSQEEANSIISALAIGTNQEKTNVSNIINRLLANNNIDTDNATNLLTALNGNTLADNNNSLSIINQLLKNSEISTAEASKLWDALITGNKQDIEDTSKIISRLLTNSNISSEDAGNLIAAMNGNRSANLQNALDIIKKLNDNGALNSADTEKIISALMTGNSDDKNNAASIISRLLINSNISSEDAGRLIAIMNGTNNTNLQNTLNIIKKLNEIGLLSQQDMDSIITAITTGDSNAVIKANDIISQLEEEGKISSRDAAQLKEVLNDTLTSNKKANTDIVTIYGKDLSSKVTTVNKSLNNIKIILEAILEKMDDEAVNPDTTSTKKNTVTTPTTEIVQNTTANKTTTTTVPTTTTTTTTNKTTARTQKEKYGVALAIWNGNYGWGTGETRINNLKAKGFDATEIQNIINQMGKDGYVYSNAWKGKYEGITDLTPYHYNKFARGVHKLSRNQLALTQEKGVEYINSPSQGMLVPLTKGSDVFNALASENLWNVANNPVEFIQDNLGLGATLPTIQSIGGNQFNGDMNIEIKLEGVKNYEDFLYKFQHDNRFEKLVRSMTIDEMFGENSLKKYKV